MRFTWAEVKAAENELSGALDTLDATEFGDLETMYLVVTPKCAYCGSFVPAAYCVKCGAPLVVYPSWRG